METLPVTLIVKAPNQQIEDQTIQCELSWTINKLKQHLSEVYPSKPPKHEQKLIYSGKLLSDSVVLKDVLRQYEGQDTHTVHLVCTPKYSPSTQADVKRQQQPVQQEANSMIANDNPTMNTTTNDENQTDQRIPNMQWFNQYNPQNLDQYTMHMLMMQQAYMQYMTQYMNLASQQGHPELQQPHQQRNNEPHVPPPQQPPPPQQQNVQPPLQQQPPPAAQQQQRDPEMNRDWLDVFYMLSRVMIFISIVYFYSSPIRCILVVGFGFCLYLYQIGFFRNVNINNNNIMQGETAEAQAPSRLMVLWTFFTTFFTSLFPEIPNVI